MTVRKRPKVAIVFACLCLGACSKSPEPGAPATGAAATAGAGVEDRGARTASIARTTATVDAARIARADEEPGNWLAHGRTYSEQRFSALKTIDATNIDSLGLAWSWDTGTTRGLEATPIVVDGVMFTTGSWSVVFAHDAKTGELLWQFDPQVPREWGKYACCDVVNRGAAVWKGRVYVGTIDGRLIALDAATGEKVWEQLTIDPERPYTITGAPRVVRDKVVIGNGGAELGVRGYVTAYDAATGAQAWRFYTVPGDPARPFEADYLKAAAATWRGGEWWTVGGGGTVWDSMAYDPDLNLLYLGVGNGSPWNRYIRSPGGGDNLYLSSIVAVNPDDGSYVWHYQTTPGDTWDYTATQHMILADLTIDGRTRKVIMQAPKNGFFYVLDRETGEFISAEAYVPVTWATHVDRETGRPVENPEAHYANEMKQIRPSPYGGHNWHPMAYSPLTGLVYIPALDLDFKYAQDNAFKWAPGEWNLGVDFAQTVPAKTVEGQIEALRNVKGHLAAWDPVTQKEAWRVPHATSWNGGVLATAGNLVFQGRSDGYFAAYAADTGKLLWEYPVHTGIIAAPVTYTVDGEQYVAVMAGWGGAFAMASGVPKHRNNVLQEGRLLAFKLGGAAALPEPVVTPIDIPEPPELSTTPEEIALGEKLYHTYCATCHGPGATASGTLPDLRYMAHETHAVWDAIVRGGAFAGKGMVGFASVLDEAQSRAVHAYVINQALTGIEFCQTNYPKEFPELFETACVRRVAQIK
jgi:quinohemoprotein ethanol dehydrogenase